MKSAIAGLIEAENLITTISLVNGSFATTRPTTRAEMRSVNTRPEKTRLLRLMVCKSCSSFVENNPAYQVLTKNEKSILFFHLAAKNKALSTDER
ncbi:MAG: hypothetical protein GTN70_02880 [Deltaproteobacteria bacterium]|nr:hypothetical protein [Deltaproteobacteria bacterium]NIS76592.1 hypothetical protein [Deltaproteobacteria bacterium]